MLLLQTKRCVYEFSAESACWKFRSAPLSRVTISVPHDRAFSPHDLSGFLERRKKGVRGRDPHVWSVVKDIMIAVPINAVRGTFPRDFVDYNRGWPFGISYYPLTQPEAESALEDGRLYPVYRQYHATLESLLRGSIERWGRERCLLLDFHGFSKQPPHGQFDVILGTGNRRTVSSEVDRELAEALSSKGYRVFLPGDETQGPMEDSYSADYTTRHYHEHFGIDSIQVEIAKHFRTREGKQRGVDLSGNIAEFLTRRFPTTES